MNEYILCIETATKNCSVSLFNGEKELVFKEESGENYIHSEKLTLFIDEVLKEANVDSISLSAVAVSSGPGSYTGLRIGVSTAKGICFGSETPLIAIPNLTQLAEQARASFPDYDYYIPMLDARRMEVYASVIDKVGQVTKETTAIEIDQSSFSKLNERRVAIFGDGAAKCLDTLGHLDVYLLDTTCSARNMGKLALEKLRKEQFEDLAYFEPFYLKEFIAGTPKKLF